MWRLEAYDASNVAVSVKPQAMYYGHNNELYAVLCVSEMWASRVSD
jgi:hypothetical protein